MNVTLVFSLLMLGSSALAASPTLVIERGAFALPDAKVEQKFVAFLKARRVAILKGNPGLDFKQQFSSVKEMFPAMDSSKTGFTNREHHCRFLRRLSENLHSQQDRAELEKLRQGGKICVAGDLQEEQRVAWSLAMHRVIWERPWLPYGGKQLTPHAFVEAVLGVPQLPQATVLSWKTATFDATYSSLSPADRDFVDGHEALRKIVARFADFDIDRQQDLDVSNEIAAYAADEAGLVADTFSPNTIIWMAPSIGPADAVDTLFHEFGHIVLDWGRANFKRDGDKVVYRKERLLDETCAETFSWLLLRSLYATFPEIEFSRVFKQYGFSQVRRSDPHFAGPAAIFASVESDSKGIAAFRRLLAAEDLTTFLREERLPPLVEAGEVNRRVIELTERSGR